MAWVTQASHVFHFTHYKTSPRTKTKIFVLRRTKKISHDKFIYISFMVVYFVKYAMSHSLLNEGDRVVMERILNILLNKPDVRTHKSHKSQDIQDKSVMK